MDLAWLATRALWSLVFAGMPVAFAADHATMPDSGIVSLLPSSPIVVGSGPVRLHVIGLGPDGAPPPGPLTASGRPITSGMMTGRAQHRRR